MFRKHLEKMKKTPLKYAERLVDALLKGFEKRFSRFFEDIKLLKAAAIHPAFRLPVVSHLNQEKLSAVKTALIAELQSLVALDPDLAIVETDGGTAIQDDADDDDYFKVMSVLGSTILL